MPSDYARIRQENEHRYGTDIGRIGQMLLADRYDDRTHFLFELLQNAEDALARRKGWAGSRAVRFELDPNVLRFSHFGKQFSDADVRGVCGIAESTKDQTAIGRFGIGFKSVYAYTSRPEVHSGNEAFAIDSFVWPTPISALKRHPDETIISLPLNAGVESAYEQISLGLCKLGPTSLLFLREIEEIEWKVANGPSGLYLRSKPEHLANGVRRIRVIGQQRDAKEIEQSWLIFYRDVAINDGSTVGQVEIAFSTTEGKLPNNCFIQAVPNSPLVVYFPTVVPTHLRFLLQGPYRTTPSRDNVTRNDPWNQHLVRETCELLIQSLKTLREMGLLNTDAIRVLPLDRERFRDGQMFAPVFEAVRAALQKENLLPSADGSHVAASRARLARSQELRELFAPGQLAAMFGEKVDVAWLSGDITQDRTPELRQYLLQELDVPEVTPETLLPRLTKLFLEAQSDEWIVRIYEFLKDRPALLRRVEEVPLIRLADGTHVRARDGNGKLQAFLSGPIETSFPTVSPTVCRTAAAVEFLKSLGLREPDPVDDVITNVLPKYRGGQINVGKDEYIADFVRIVTAFRSDSTSQRSRLIDALRVSLIVRAVDAGKGERFFATPGVVYIATERLCDLFEGVADVLLVDDSYECLRGEAVRDLLVASGASRYLRLKAAELPFTSEQRVAMRRAAGCEDCTYDVEIKDTTLAGLDSLLKHIPHLVAEKASIRARLLWESLVDVEERSGASAFSGTYTWMYYQSRTYRFDAAFVRLLNDTSWVPAADGVLHPPREIMFDTLGWKPAPFLQTKILFKPPIIEQLAKEAGIDPGVLDLLRRLGVTSEDELRRRLRVEPGSGEKEEDGSGVADDNAAPVDGKGEENFSGEPAGEDDDDSGEQDDVVAGSKDGPGRKDGGGGGGDHKAGPQGDRRKTEGGRSRPFISYIGTHPEDEDEHDPDGLSRDERMALEAVAIDLILKNEPSLERTKTNNPGFDLWAMSNGDVPIKWVEVKAMTGSLEDRSVCLSRTQFDCAWIHGEAYWLYVVEHAIDPDRARILRIKDPAGNAKNFTFDQGWRHLASPGDEAVSQDGEAL